MSFKQRKQAEALYSLYQDSQAGRRWPSLTIYAELLEGGLKGDERTTCEALCDYSAQRVRALGICACGERDCAITLRYGAYLIAKAGGLQDTGIAVAPPSVGGLLARALTWYPTNNQLLCYERYLEDADSWFAQGWAYGESYHRYVSKARAGAFEDDTNAVFGNVALAGWLTGRRTRSARKLELLDMAGLACVAPTETASALGVLCDSYRETSRRTGAAQKFFEAVCVPAIRLRSVSRADCASMYNVIRDDEAGAKAVLADAGYSDSVWEHVKATLALAHDTSKTARKLFGDVHQVLQDSSVWLDDSKSAIVNMEKLIQACGGHRPESAIVKQWKWLARHVRNSGRGVNTTQMPGELASEQWAQST